MSPAPFSGRCILLLGATSGIGRSMAEALHNMPHQPTVICAGRRQDRLDEMVKAHPGGRMKAVQCDQNVQLAELTRFAASTLEAYPELDSVFFVAGIQHRLDLAKGKDLDFDAFHEELNVNYISLVTLAQLFVPHMQAQAKKGKQATLATVTSGLAFVPMPSVALYCATKAAVRSYTISLRQVLREAGVKVIEIAPPLVESELHDKQEGTRKMIESRWMPLTEFTSTVMAGLADGKDEIMVGMAANGYSKPGSSVVALVADIHGKHS